MPLPRRRRDRAWEQTYMRRLGVAMPSGAAFGIALRRPWKLGAWFLGGAQGRGVRHPHPGVASTTPAVFDRVIRFAARLMSSSWFTSRAPDGCLGEPDLSTRQARPADASYT